MQSFIKHVSKMIDLREKPRINNKILFDLFWSCNFWFVKLWRLKLPVLSHVKLKLFSQVIYMVLWQLMQLYFVVKFIISNFIIFLYVIVLCEIINCYMPVQPDVSVENVTQLLFWTMLDIPKVDILTKTQ